MNAENIKASERRLVFWSSTMLAMLAFISLNIYLPSLPSLSKVFAVPPNDLKLSITLFLLGFSLSQFFWGSLSSRYGRKKILLLGLAIAGISTFLVMISSRIWWFNSARLVEGFGVGAASVLCRTMLTDALDKHTLIRALSHISSLGNLMPALAPILGGYIILFFNWRAIFLLLFVFTLLIFIVCARSIPETNLHIKHNFNFKDALKEYADIFKHRVFLSYLLPYLLLSGGMIAYYSVMPFIFVSVLHIPAQHYSFFSIATVISYIIGANLAGILYKILGSQKTIILGLNLAIISALIFLILAFHYPLSAWTITAPMIIYTLAAGIVAPTAAGGALNELRHMAGASAAVLGATIYGGSALCTVFISSLNLAQLSTLFWYVGTISVLALLGFLALRK